MTRKMRKVRLDLLLSERRPDLSRNRIRSEIMAGNVMVNGLVFDKPGTLVEDTVEIMLARPENPYVSRGGLKLEGALRDLFPDVRDMVVLDVGASTGGFTDCLLKKGAKFVYALDVGYGQLDQRLRNDPRVEVMERFNVRRLKPGDLPEIPDLAVIDISFISLSKVLPVLAKIKIPVVMALVKPQFEAGRKDAGKGGGVIRDPALHRKVLNETIAYACKVGYCCRGMTFSRWPGPKGNIEYFVLLNALSNDFCTCNGGIADTVVKIVKQAHDDFSGNK